MNSPPFLTDEEVESITAPLVQGAARMKYFRRLGVNVKPKPNGQPLVGRAEFEAAMMDRRRTAVPARQQPNVIDWQAVRAIRKRAATAC